MPRFAGSVRAPPGNSEPGFGIEMKSITQRWTNHLPPPTFPPSGRRP
jgi:hypothetical protein